MNANKTNVKEAVENLFGVNVKKINIIVTKGKTKRFKGKKGKRKDIKKAIISFEKGENIDITTTTVVRAVAVSQDPNFLDSFMESNTYFINTGVFPFFRGLPEITIIFISHLI